MKRGTVQGKEEGAAVVITEIDICLHKYQKILKGQFLFQLEVAELISCLKKELLTGSLRCHFVKAAKPISCSWMFHSFPPRLSTANISSVVIERERFAIQSNNLY